VQGVSTVLAWAAVAAGLSGCGGGGGGHRGTGQAAGAPERAAANPSPATPADASSQAGIYGGPAPLLVYFKRVVGGDPLASQLIVDTDGSASALITLGGPSGEKKHIFTMAPAQLHRLHGLVARTHLRNTWCCDTNYYVYWVTVRGRSWRLQQRRVPRSMRPLINELDAITDAHTGF
jgi:hypothetical protein